MIDALGKGRGISVIRREAVNDPGIGKRGSCHMVRHTMATLMLENGADVRLIQAMLGHAGLKTTEICTQVSIKALKAVRAGDEAETLLALLNAEANADEA